MAARLYLESEEETNLRRPLSVARCMCAPFENEKKDGALGIFYSRLVSQRVSPLVKIRQYMRDTFDSVSGGRVPGVVLAERVVEDGRVSKDGCSRA